MHLISAAIISLLLKKGHKGSKFPFSISKPIPSFPGILEYVHGIPGRHRLRIPSLIGSSENAAQLAEKLPVIPGITSIHCDTRSGSMIVKGTPDLNPGLLVAASARILDLDEKIERMPSSKMSLKIKHFWKGLDRAIYDKTGGLIKANDAISVFLLGATLIQIRKTRTLGLPPAFTLLWWFYTLSHGKSNNG